MRPKDNRVKIIAFTLISLASFTLNAQAIKGKKEILLDNEKVEVIRVTYPVGSESGFHTHHHPHRVVYVVEGGKLKLIPSKDHKKANTINVKTGDTLFIPANSHNVVNIGDTRVVLVETELKK